MRFPFVSFVDLFALMLAILFLLPTKPDIAEADNARAGMLVVEAHWPDYSKTDIDLWVKAPGDNPVGYSRLRGNYFSLFRDDLGIEDGARWRFEIAAARVIPDGEYAANLHAYRDMGGRLPFLVDVVVWYRAGTSNSKTVVWQGAVPVARPGQEITALRWSMRDGRYVPGSIHYSPIDLRSRVYDTAPPG